jgi:hypothetical protein
LCSEFSKNLTLSDKSEKFWKNNLNTTNISSFSVHISPYEYSTTDWSDDEVWKKYANATNNSTLSLHISAIKNSAAGNKQILRSRI